MKKNVYFGLGIILIILGLVCAFVANIPGFWLSDSFGAVGICDIFLLFSMFAYGGMRWG